MLRPVVLAALTFTCALACARADVYRWVDEQGEPHYSDQWVPGSVVIKTVRAHPASSDAGARTVQQKTLTAANTRISEQLSEQENARAVQEDLAKSRETRCKSAKDQYLRAITSRRVYKQDKDGERTYMSDEEADAWREQLRKATQDACGSVPQFDPNAPIPEPQPIPEPKVNPAAATTP
jgi:hypothetical protein